MSLEQQSAVIVWLTDCAPLMMLVAADNSNADTDTDIDTEKKIE